MPGVASSIYNSLFRRNAIFLGTVFVAAFGFEIVFDTTTDMIWDRMNQGRQWKDIKAKYMQAPEDEDE